MMSKYFLCNKQDIPNHKTRGFSIDIEQGKLELFLLRQDDRVTAYKNHCPHLGITLNWQPDEFMSQDGSHIQCSTHGALFNLEDGHCIAGPCTGENLTPLTSQIEHHPDGEIWLVT
ncbi:MAG: Rieske (2Fe-2S) protein [Gammaproteobacteria bacterium]|nr:Rieske (2Fe-2S) protein [Gammaproteobacteria bacterium]MDH5592482.1 Rieske (2Fe-2S) protein [Gammaproteobacteria bacterium]